MKKLLGIMVASTVLVFAAGCTPNDGQGTAQNSAPPTSSSSPRASGTASPKPAATTPGPTAAATTAAPGDSTTPPGASDSPLSSIDLNSRGNEPQQVGQTGVFGAATGDKFATLTATKIQTNFKCTEPSAAPSVNGQFVALTIDVTAGTNFADSGWPNLSISNTEFRGWDASGKQLLDPIGNSAGCVKASDLLQSPVEPGKSQSGLVILDVPAGAGSAAFVVGGFEGSYGWEWHW